MLPLRDTWAALPQETRIAGHSRMLRTVYGHFCAPSEAPSDSSDPERLSVPAARPSEVPAVQGVVAEHLAVDRLCEGKWVRLRPLQLVKQRRRGECAYARLPLWQGLDTAEWGMQA